MIYRSGGRSEGSCRAISTSHAEHTPHIVAHCSTL